VVVRGPGSRLGWRTLAKKGYEDATQVGRAHSYPAGAACVSGGHDDAFEAGTTGFGDTSLTLAAGTKFARQADLPDCCDPRWKRCVALCRGDGEGNGEVGRRFVDADSACNCNKNVAG